MTASNPSRLRRLARPALLVGTVTALGALGYLFVGPGGEEIHFPPFIDAAIDAPLIDAPSDAAPDAGINLETPWVLHTIVAWASCVGADGTNLGDYDSDGKTDIVTGCEQGNKIYVARNLGAGLFSSFALPGTGLSGPEDARFGDVDGDGKPDVVIAESGGAKLRWYRNNGAAGSAAFDSPTTITTGTIRYMHAAVHSPGVIFAGSYSTGAEVARFNASAPYTTWTKTTIVGANWVKGLEIHGTSLWIWDYLGSKRGVYEIQTATTGSGSVQANVVSEVYTLRGTRKGSTIVTATGSSDGTSPGASAHIVGGVTATFPSSFGRAQAVTLCDLDGDSTDDMVLTGSHSNSPATSTTEPPSALSSVAWIKGGAFTVRGEISGALGIKHDNAECLDVDGDGDLDVITTEEKSLGLVWYENPRLHP